ncbi:MAG: hypothetical protein ACOX1P_18325 [Thermoguttaceae bacterium]|jgi:hypothetical protein
MGKRKTADNGKTLTIDSGVFQSRFHLVTVGTDRDVTEQMQAERAQALNLSAWIARIQASVRQAKARRGPFSFGSLEDMAAAVAIGHYDPEAVEALLKDMLDLRAAGHHNAALAAAIRLGRYYERMLNRGAEPHARRGKQVLGGAKRGHAGVHGTPEERAARDAELVAAFRESFKADSKRTRLYKKIAQDYGVSPKTVQRAVKEAGI